MSPKTNESIEPSVSQIDLSQYRTPDLVATIGDLLTLGGKAWRVLIWSVIGCVTLVGGVTLCLFGEIPWAVFAALITYAIPAGALSGIGLGVAEQVRRGAESMLTIVDLLLEETAIVARDVQRLGSGTHELPPAGVLVDAVYHRLLFPIVQETISDRLGPLGRPVVWLYRRTLDRLVRVVIRRVVPASFVAGQDPGGGLTQNVASLGSGLVDEEALITDWLRWTREKVVAVTGWLKLLIALPCYLVSGVVFLLTLLPIIITWYLFATGSVESNSAASLVIRVALVE